MVIASLPSRALDIVFNPQKNENEEKESDRRKEDVLECDDYFYRFHRYFHTIR